MTSRTTPYMRLLFWLKWKLMIRGLARNPTATVGLAIAGFFMFFASLGLAIGLGFGLAALPPPMNEHLLRGALFGMYTFWLLAPTFGYALTDSYDITKLFVYPVSPRMIFTGSILGSMLDAPVLFFLPSLVVAMVVFAMSSAVALVAVPLLVLLFLFHTIALSQIIVLATAGMLRSRKFKDFAVVILPLFWVAYQVLNQMFFRGAAQVDWRAFVQSRTWDLVSYLPPGLAGRAIGAFSRGEVLPAILFTVFFAALTAGAVYMAGWLVNLVCMGEVITPELRRKKATEAVISPVVSRSDRVSGGLFGRLPPVIQAVFDKEIKYMFRDPLFKIMLMRIAYIAVIMIISFFRPGAREGLHSYPSFGPAIAWMVVGFSSLMGLSILFNNFGTDGHAAATLFMFPASRREMIVGKNLAYLVALAVANTVLILITCVASNAMGQFLYLLLCCYLSLLVGAGVGNIMSIWFPIRLVVKGFRIQQQQASQGIGYAFIYLGAMLAGLVLSLPVVAAFVMPVFFVNRAWLVITIPVAIAYAAGIYYLSLKVGTPLLMERELDVVAALTREE